MRVNVYGCSLPRRGDAGGLVDVVGEMSIEGAEASRPEFPGFLAPLEKIPTN